MRTDTVSRKTRMLLRSKKIWAITGLTLLGGGGVGIIALEGDPIETKTFYDLEDFKAFQLNEFPFEKICKTGSIPWFPSTLANWWYDQHTTIEVQYYLKSEPETSQLSCWWERKNQGFIFIKWLLMEGFSEANVETYYRWYHKNGAFRTDHTNESMHLLLDNLIYKPLLEKKVLGHLFNAIAFSGLQKELYTSIEKECVLDKPIAIHLRYRKGIYSMMKELVE